MTTKVCLIVIDGWGICNEKKGNAILNANTPVMDSLTNTPGHSLTLDASGLSVGLPAGLMGNSEVGHTNIGAGRIVYQDIVEINMAVTSKEIYHNKTFTEACTRAKKGTGRLHLLGLGSDGGVHSHIDHLFALLEGAKIQEVPKTFVQFFGDGRDTNPVTTTLYAQQVLDHIKRNNYGELGVIVGRYYAMDRDNRWERIKIAYDGLVSGEGEKTTAGGVIQLIQSRYDARGELRQTDEFLTPIICADDALIKDGDTLVFINFRSDRMREIVEAFGIQRQFSAKKTATNLGIFCMTEYKAEFPFPLLFPPSQPTNVLGEWISKKGLAQFHTAETEKYAHVTFFFNGGREDPFPLEDRLLVSSPKVATYDLKPEMSCIEVALEMVRAISSKKYAFLLLNFAPPDMVGHTGKYDATIKAVETTDRAVGMVKEACDEHGYILFITADHGNAEVMIDENGGPVTSHSTNRVPFLMTGRRKFRELTHDPALCDVAPTILDVMAIAKPEEMTGQSLLEPSLCFETQFL